MSDRALTETSDEYPVVKKRFLANLRHACRTLFFESRWFLLLAVLAAGIGFAVGLAVNPPFGPSASALDTAHQITYRFLLLFAPVFALLLFRVRGWALVLTVAAICIPTAFVWAVYDLHANRLAASVSYIGAMPVARAYEVKVLLVVAGILSPVLATWLYQRAGILDRYLVRQFAVPFLFCVVAFFSIWLVFDLNDNLPDFREGKREGHASFGQILGFYAFQIPHIFTKIAQAAVLIATVYALSKMSRGNEFIAILGSGRSLLRTLTPLFLTGAYVSFIYLVFSYEWAPWAEGKKELTLDQFSGDQRSSLAERHLYHNDEANRTWYIGTIPFDLASEPLRTVDIFEFDETQRLRRSYQAESARWDWRKRAWLLQDVHITRFPDDPQAAPERVPPTADLPPIANHRLENWKETPWELINQKVDPEYLGVPGLLSYLRTKGQTEGIAPFRTNLHHRWASPWSCLTILFVAAPLGIAFTRRRIFGGVASAIFLFGAVLFFTELFLALGKGGHIPAAVAAWLANGVFLVLGILFLYLRSRNRRLSLFPRSRFKPVRDALPPPNLA